MQQIKNNIIFIYKKQGKTLVITLFFCKMLFIFGRKLLIDSCRYMFLCQSGGGGHNIYRRG